MDGYVVFHASLRCAYSRFIKDFSKQYVWKSQSGGSITGTRDWYVHLLFDVLPERNIHKLFDATFEGGVQKLFAEMSQMDMLNLFAIISTYLKGMESCQRGWVHALL
ncbi:dynamin-related protein 5A [Sesbania bispinosa]|nr:dynamin-related protein 5A [Sesbania bispinosa]